MTESMNSSAISKRSYNSKNHKNITIYTGIEKVLLKERGTYILHLWLDLHIRIDAEHQILDRAAHALVVHAAAHAGAVHGLSSICEVGVRVPGGAADSHGEEVVWGYVGRG